jgi:hypothetical protein
MAAEQWVAGAPQAAGGGGVKGVSDPFGGLARRPLIGNRYTTFPWGIVI